MVTASSGDYIFGAGGTLARYAREGWRITVAQFGNDDKMSLGRAPAWTRLTNVTEGEAAGKYVGTSEVVRMGHLSGQLGELSSTEMRNQLFGMIRGKRPRIIFLPDPYVHYQDDSDAYWLGRTAEEAWGYSGGGTFANELTRMGFKPYGAPEVFYYSAWRPYRAGEGGEEAKAAFRAVDVTDFIGRKLLAAQTMYNRNRTWARIRFGIIEDARVDEYVREFVQQMAQTIGKKHGFAYGEEFNHVGAAGGVPPWALERARGR
ncbi:MAG: hypothetical protein U0Q16_22330 [Bryobacteraceae bacterium]